MATLREGDRRDLPESSRQRVKVLHLGKFDGDVGGIERYVRALLGGLPEDMQAINLVANDVPRTDEHRQFRYLTVRAASHGVVASVAIAPSMPLLARRLQREHRFDIVHLHFPDPLGQVTAMTLPRSVKRVISWHSDIVKQRAALALYRPFLDAFVHDVDAIIGATPQHFSASQQMAPGKPGQLREVIPYGFDADAFGWTDAARRRRAELDAQPRARLVIFTVGRHVYYKGFDVLIRALRSVDADLWIGGRGPLTESLRQQARDAGVADRVRFLGFIPDDELVAYYEACDIFCMPSTERAEQFGLVQLEAMHCGKPVVATRLGTGVEYVTQDGVTGLLVEPGKVEALAEALNRLLGDANLRARLGAAGRQRVEREFSVRQMIEKTAALYRRLAPGPGK
jgi:glycosyltransferase involved in cell wall biosynthesis